MLILLYVFNLYTIYGADSSVHEHRDDSLHSSRRTVHLPSGLHPSGKLNRVTANHEKFSFVIHELPLPKNKTLEDRIPSWCTNEPCEITPRTYFHPVTTNFTLLGFTDVTKQGHVVLLDKDFRPRHHVLTSVNGSAGAVSGIYGFHDGSFAVMLYVDATTVVDRQMWLQFYRSDLSVEWSRMLNSPISVPDRNIGDFRLSYGNGYFLAYFSVYGIKNFAADSNGEQATFVSEYGDVKTTSFNVPGQKFVKTGDIWGCSHSLGQLTSFHSQEEQFIVACSADKFPEGISVGDTETGSLIFRSKVNGRGLSSAQLGQIAEASQGFKMVFNAVDSCKTSDCHCCPAKGIGFVTIYNDLHVITGSRDVDDVIWLTSSNGSSERDPVIARIYIGSELFRARERFLVGWRDASTNEYRLGIVNKFGSFVKPAASVSNFSFTKNDTHHCTSFCALWGERDDSFKTLKDGRVGWIYGPPLSKSIWIYEVGIEGVAGRSWSLWSSWSRCSRSCGGGEKTRIRSCLSEDCGSLNPVDKTQCNTAACKIPITCSFNFTSNHELGGDLFVNGERVFGFTLETAKEKCVALRDVCRGLTEKLSGNIPFYFLNAADNLVPADNSIASVMKCQETPGWSTWSTWMGCSVSCGSGHQVRTRYCDGDVPGSKMCEGRQVEDRQRCNTGRCPHWSDWNEWTTCSATCNTGIQLRSRICAGDYPEQCDWLTAPLDDIRNCSLGTCPHWTTWLPWSACSKTCGQGIEKRRRNCLGDFPCLAAESGTLDHENRSCVLGLCAYWSHWHAWSTCRHSCGNSTRTRTRKCSGNYSIKDGCPLPADRALQTGRCNLGACPYWSEWSGWSVCSRSCGQGTHMKTRSCLGDFPSEYCHPYGGRVESEICNPGLCGYLDEWSSFSRCSASCGEGFQTRQRQCLGDFPCSDKETLFENISCSLGACPFWSLWDSWGPCTETCGTGGKRKKTRRCLGDFPHLCVENASFDLGRCEEMPQCPRWNDWSQWSVCSESCDRGIKHRTRRCEAEILETCGFIETANSNPFEENNITVSKNSLGDFFALQEKQCLTGECSYWLDWVTWSPCSASCDEGLSSRSRACFGDFPLMCFETGSDVETRSCVIGTCGVWEDWGSWGFCSRTCGKGLWTRTRQCLGDFSEMCKGVSNETSVCDVADCVDVCQPNPCSNGGMCRRNDHLTRMYHCICTPGWMGKHCNQYGPDLMCEPDNIILSFDRKVVEEEGLTADDPGLVSLLSRDSVDCTAMFDHYNTTEYYLIVAPAPIDSSCGSQLEITRDFYRVRNQVIWQIEDRQIRSTVLLLDFSCVYLKDASVSSSSSSVGTLTLDSFRREVEFVTADGTFEVDITLYQDSAFQKTISPGGGHPLVSLAEGELVFVSVDLRSRHLLPSGDTALVMDTCFVTSSKSNREPLLYLIQNSCPYSPFVTVMGNGVSRSGRFSVRVFGWTGTDRRADMVFIHCSALQKMFFLLMRTVLQNRREQMQQSSSYYDVSVCNKQDTNCVPKCVQNTSARSKRSVATMNRYNLSQSIQRYLLQSRLNRIKKQQRSEDMRQITSVSSNGHPFISFSKLIPPLANGKSKLNLSSRFDPKTLVSFGPLQVLLSPDARSRKTREAKILPKYSRARSLLSSIVGIFCAVFSVCILLAAIVRLQH